MKKLNVVDWIALVLVVVGGLNWGLVGFFSFDLVAWLFGSMSAVSRVIYVLVWLGAIYTLVTGIRLGVRPVTGPEPTPRHGTGT